MATITYSGSQSDAVALSAARTVSLSGSGSASGIINSVTATLTFSTNAYSNTYNITAVLTFSGGSATSTRQVKMDSSNYTNGAFAFTFDGITADQANSITSVTVSCSDSTRSKVFLKGSQSVVVDYTVIGKTTAPTTVAVASTGVAPGASAKLSWSGAAAGEANAITGYKVYRATSSSGTYSLLATITTTATSSSTAVTAPTTSGSSYYYKVQTVGTYSGYDGDMSSTSASLTCTVGKTVAPESVTLAATKAAPGASVKLSWSGAAAGNNNSITGYKVYRAASEYGTYSLLATITTTATSGSTTVTAPSDNGSSYYYKVQTVGAYSGYDSDNSSAVGLTCVIGNTTAPESASLAVATSAPGAKIKLSWSGASAGENNPITGYKVYRSTSQYSGYSVLETLSSTATSGSTTVTAPTTNGVVYYYKVQTIGTHDGHDGDMTSYAVSLTCTFASTGSPTTVRIEATNVAPTASVLLTWTGASAGENNDITGYKVYRADSVEGDYTLLTSVESTATSGSTTVNAPAVDGDTYYFRVVTVGTLDGSDSSLSSAYAALTCTYSSPTAPTVKVNGQTNAYALPGTNVTVTWTGAEAGANNTIIGYTLYRDGSVLADNLAESVSSYDVTAHSSTGNAYTFTVVAKGTYSNSAPSGACTLYSYTDPAAPTTVTVSDSNPNAGAKVTLSWSGATPGGYNSIIGYHVYRSTSVNGTYTLATKVTTTAAAGSCKVSAASTPGSIYYYKVETVGSYSVSGLSTGYASVTAGEAPSIESDIKVIIQPRPRKPRGFVFGDYDTILDGQWTLAGWTFEEPDPYTYYVDVPGRKAGPLDMSDALTGYPTYGLRKMEVRLECSEGTRMEREALIRDIVNRLHGHRMEIVMPDDDTRYAVGRISVHKEYNDMAHAAVTLTATCEPWLYSKREKSLVLVAEAYTQTVVLHNAGKMQVVPQITITGDDAWSAGIRVTLSVGGAAWNLPEGTHILPDLVLPKGHTVVSYSGSGTMTIRYREAIL